MLILYKMFASLENHILFFITIKFEMSFILLACHISTRILSITRLDLMPADFDSDACEIKDRLINVDITKQ